MNTSRFTKPLSLLLMLCLLSLALPAHAQQRRRAPRRDVGTKVLTAQAQAFIDSYTAEYQRLYTASSNAEWDSNTRIVEGDETNAERTKEANERIAAFTGSTLNVAMARRFLSRRRELASLQVKQLERIIYFAGASPESARDTVRERIAAETRQNEKLYGYTFKIDGKPVTPNQIDEILRSSTNVEERRKAWLASKEVGKELRDGLADLQRLRNAVVAPLGYKSFNTYQVAEYGMSAEEMQRLMDGFLRELRPLYRELHTYARYELAKRYNQPVPDELPPIGCRIVGRRTGVRLFRSKA
jgi:peptidyl-dipeptidase A